MIRSYKRHIAKSITWRFIGTLDTILLAWLISGDPLTGFQIGFAEVITKMLLYYIHERLWFKLRSNENSKRRHLVKTVTWRGIGTIDTMFLAWAISGNPMIGLKVGGAEVLTKMFLYYLHERAWYKLELELHQKSEPITKLESSSIKN